jgi:hypothetical protein
MGNKIAGGLAHPTSWRAKFSSSSYDAGAHRPGRHSMAVFEKTNKLSAYEPAAKNLSCEAEGQFVLNVVCENASCGAVRLHSMGVFPAVERTFNLDVPELAPFDVIAVLEYPPNPEWAQVNAKNSTIAVMDSRCPLYDFNGLPWWC